MLSDNVQLLFLDMLLSHQISQIWQESGQSVFLER